MEQSVETNNATTGPSENESSSSSDQTKNSIRKVLQDLVRDLLHTFPELEGQLDPRLTVLYSDEESVRADKALESLVEHFNGVFPERFLIFYTKMRKCLVMKKQT